MLKSLNIKRIKFILILILAALGMVSILQGCKNACMYSQDFQWDAAKVLTLGMDPYDESLNPSPQLKALGYEEYYLQMEANQFPSLLLLLFPYTLLPPLAARYAWLISNLIFTVAVALLMRKLFFKDTDIQDFTLVILMMIAGTPWRNHIGVGQHTIFAFMFFLLSLYLYEKAYGKKGLLFLAAMALSVSYFKYTLTAPLALYYIYKKRYGVFALSILPHILLTGFAALYLRDSFINMIKKPLEVASWLSGEGSLDLGSILTKITGSEIFRSPILTLVFMLLLLAFVLLYNGKDDISLLSVLTLAALIITYHRSYDFFVMVLPFAGFLRKGSGKKLLYAYIILTAIIFWCLRIFHESDLSLILAAAYYYLFFIIFLKQTACSRQNSSGI